MDAGRWCDEEEDDWRAPSMELSSSTLHGLSDMEDDDAEVDDVLSDI